MTYAARHRPDEQALREALAQSFEKDRARGFTVWVHTETTCAWEWRRAW